MGGDKHHHLFHIHLPHLTHHGGRREGGEAGLPPKGWMAIRVGEEGGEQQRFVVPVGYLNHPLFARLLKEAEEEYGFEQKGAITIPCHVEHFCQVRRIIDSETGASCSSGHHHHHHHHHHYHLVGCFRA